jgi:hypothetical protein
VLLELRIKGVRGQAIIIIIIIIIMRVHAAGACCWSCASKEFVGRQ